jgi:hypothetical protein
MSRRFDDYFEKKTILIRGAASGIGQPEEIAELALSMYSNACKYMTADMRYVSGGGWK